MKKQSLAALIGGGSLSHSPLVGLTGLPQHLGPVKAVSLRVASRFSNALRAGHPVAGFDAFQSCTLVLISVPDSAVPETVQALAESGLRWRSRLVVLCSNLLGVEALKPLTSLEASTGSFGLVPGFDSWFLLEGEKGVARAIRPMINARSKVTLVAAGEKLECVKSLSALSSGIVPLIRDTAERWRGAEFSNPETEQILDRHINRALRSFFRSGKSSNE